MCPVEYTIKDPITPDNPAIIDGATIYSNTRGKIFDGQESFVIDQVSSPLKIDVQGSGQVTITPQEGGPGQPLVRTLNIGETMTIRGNSGKEIKLKRTRR